MGLSDALRNRLALARGESLGETIRIFLASKEERRKIAARKFPGRAVPTGAASRAAGPTVPDDMVAALLDAAWYAEANGLSSDAAGHFRDHGLAAGLAPRAALAGPDGRHLTPRGAELLHRLGLLLGAVSKEAEGADTANGLDPWAIGNPKSRPLAVVTAIASTHERLPYVPAQWAERADFYVVSDYAFDEPGPWQSVRPVYHNLDPDRVAAFAKTHLPTFFHAYPRVLWLDPSVLCCSDPAEIAGASAAALACFRIEDRTPAAAAAEAAAAGGDAPEVVADFLGSVAPHPAFDLPGVLDASVLLLDPTDEAVRRLMGRWWRYLMRGPVSDRLALTLAAADMPEVAPMELPGRELHRSPAFARRGAA
jgi:hypothetical protein